MPWAALHHLIVRGIERRRIFEDDRDRNDFVRHLGDLLLDTSTPCYAGALLAKHAYLLVRTGTVPGGSLLSYWAVRELGIKATELAKRFEITQPAVSISVKRGQRIANERALTLHFP